MLEFASSLYLHPWSHVLSCPVSSSSKSGRRYTPKCKRGGTWNSMHRGGPIAIDAHWASACGAVRHRAECRGQPTPAHSAAYQ